MLPLKIFHTFSSVSIVDFEQVNVSWVKSVFEKICTWLVSLSINNITTIYSYHIESWTYHLPPNIFYMTNFFQVLIVLFHFFNMNVFCFLLLYFFRNTISKLQLMDQWVIKALNAVKAKYRFLFVQWYIIYIKTKGKNWRSSLKRRWSFL